jgi:hypothetical protein
VSAPALPVPLALVLACASPCMSGLIASRARRGFAPLDPAWVSLHGNRYFASVRFADPARCAVIVPLDVWTRDLTVTPDSGLSALRGVALPENTALPSVAP